jgi:group I intron endonuclease
MIGIYKITSPSGKIYVGQSIDIDRRFKRYKKQYPKNQLKLYNSFIKHGVESHVFEVLEECTIEELNSKERYYQDLFFCISTNGLNLKLTQTEDKSGVLSSETRLLISKKSIGRKHSEESKIKVTNSLIGNTRRKGILHSEEVKANMSIKRKGKPQCKLAVEKRASLFRKLILDLETGIYYLGIKEASTAKSIKECTLKARINSKSYNSTLIYV